MGPLDCGGKENLIRNTEKFLKMEIYFDFRGECRQTFFASSVSLVELLAGLALGVLYRDDYVLRTYHFSYIMKFLGIHSLWRCNSNCRYLLLT